MSQGFALSARSMAKPGGEPQQKKNMLLYLSSLRNETQKNFGYPYLNLILYKNFSFFRSSFFQFRLNYAKKVDKIPTKIGSFDLGQKKGTTTRFSVRETRRENSAPWLYPGPIFLYRALRLNCLQFNRRTVAFSRFA
nr:hypothetical protein [Trentepohlia sp. YN1317]